MLSVMNFWIRAAQITGSDSIQFALFRRAIDERPKQRRCIPHDLTKAWLIRRMSACSGFFHKALIPLKYFIEASRKPAMAFGTSCSEVPAAISDRSVHAPKAARQHSLLGPPICARNLLIMSLSRQQAQSMFFDFPIRVSAGGLSRRFLTAKSSPA
ncbi:MAG: hypothetical protein LBW85_07675 [Deltaproteobacteria bacterium]|nr:hypothetical protein [Deltaproteobacteria bacterium]